MTAVLIMSLLIWGISRRTKSDTSRDSYPGPVVYPDEPSQIPASSDLGPGEAKKSPSGFHRCPLCGTVLEKREKVRSVLYPGVPDGKMEIYGCPYCYGPKANTERICPVCHRSLRPEDLVYARFFQSKERRHAHILGCSTCYKSPFRF